MRTGIIQQQNSRSTADNRIRLTSKIEQCASQGAELVILQELHDTLYFCQTEDVSNFELAEAVEGGSTTAWYGSLARRLGIVIVTSLFERQMAGVYYNTIAVLERDGAIAGRYRKMHIPDDPGFYEKFYFKPGDLGFEPVSTSVGRLGALVCWDQWFPEAARAMALKGAELLLYPTAIGWSSFDAEDEQRRQQEAWQTVQRGHAIANGLPLVAVNRVGHEADPSGHTDGIQFWGHSFACGPQGEVLYQSPDESEDVAVVDIDMGRSETVRRWWPFFRDRRTGDGG
jgi:N-carbamoylputrescine amidase